MSRTLVAQQLLTLARMAAFGWCLMLAAHLGRALAQCGGWGRGRQAAWDFLFCLVWGLLFWLALLRWNGGLLRNYVCLGLAGGAVVYWLLCRARCERFCRFLARVLLRGWRGLRRILLWPAEVLRRFCLRPCRACLRRLRTRVKKIFLPPQQETETDTENFIKK